jgi:diguanylate cyclase (GGDEF)-like protein
VGYPSLVSSIILWSLTMTSKFDLDESFVRDSKFNKMIVETRFDRQKFRETKQREMLDRQRKQLTDEELEDLERSSLVDPVTNLYNQRAFYRKLEYEVRRAKRYKRPLSLIVMAVDNIEPLQRQYGHMVVDEILRAAAVIFDVTIRDVDIAGRMDGHKLGIILPETYSSRAAVVAERIRERIKLEPVNNELRTLRVTASFGLVSFPTHARDEVDLVKRAIEFLDMAIVQGGDCVYSG